ncbi:MAG: zinc-dependent metalloprotease [Gammaproteobacteria bacterium]
MKYADQLPTALLLSIAALSSPLAAQEADEDAETENKTIAETTENSDRFDGLFTLYRDRDTGQSYLEIGAEQLNREYIYMAVSTDGVVQGGHFRGNYRDNRVLSLTRHFDRIEIRSENTAFYFDPDSPLSRAADANISTALLVSESILAEDEDSGRILIDADNIFVNETLSQIKASPDPDDSPEDAFRLGDLSDEKSKITEIRNYPFNTEVHVEYVYENPAPVVSGASDITDSRYVSIYVQHSLLAMPENGYRPRLTDHRMGYFAEQVTDLTDDSPTPYRDLVQRWHLVKKDPGAVLSEPVEPITWWIENTTPLEFRDAIREGVLAWNQSFEKIGFRNALVVQVQPDDADWDAGDVRYNVLRWTSSPNPPFSGYGPSFTNPRTGQILGADIMLEYAGVIRRVRYQQILDSLESPGSELPASRLSSQRGYCSFGFSMQLSQVFGRFAINALDMNPALEEQVTEEYLIDLVLHEVGHTLGFAHNFASSHMLTLDESYDRDAVDQAGLYASVMDYTDIHIAPPGREHTQFFTTQPGPYDDWVVNYSYSIGSDDPNLETPRLATIAARSTEPALLFGTDDHVMARPGRAMDPRILWYDMTSDPIGYAEQRLGLIEELLGVAREKQTTEGESYHQLRDAYIVMLAQFSRSITVLSRYIGGVYINRSVAGQPGAATPFVPVSLTDQQRVMAGLADHLFAPDAFSASAGLYSHLQEQRRLWNFWNETEDPKVHEWLLALQRGVLAHLLHPTVMTRITDSRLFGNEYPLADFMADLTDAIFAEDLRGDVNTFRQNLQLEYVSRLIDVVTGSDGYDHPSQSMALYNLRTIEKMMNGKRRGNIETRAHTDSILYVIRRALEGEA